MYLFPDNVHPKRLLSFLFCLILFSINTFGQPGNYTVSNAHAHNDYLHPVPFFTAFKAGFGSIEADVFTVNGVLMVAHNKSSIQSKRTLTKLYIEPLSSELVKDRTRKVKLLIDIKENYKEALALLIGELEPLKKYFYSNNNLHGQVTILISGNRPSPAEYKNYPVYIYFDDDLKLFHSQMEWQRVGLVSLRFKDFSSWNGKDTLLEKDKELLKNTIDRVHHAGKEIRFWDAPDNESSWLLQMKLGVDLIGTDRINELAGFLKQ